MRATAKPFSQMVTMVLKMNSVQAQGLRLTQPGMNCNAVRGKIWQFFGGSSDRAVLGRVMADLNHRTSFEQLFICTFSRPSVAC
mmetsp:Transcript_10286/g.22629  ORF Transcript_10286/g.22629 Transcript_10286/m.22629 type:complete len:84 (-) Transcript_10286:289-540(-)